MTITFAYEPPEEGVYEVDVTFYEDGELLLQHPVSTVFNPGPFDKDLTDQRIQVFVETLEIRMTENVPLTVGDN